MPRVPVQCRRCRAQLTAEAFTVKSIAESIADGDLHAPAHTAVSLADALRLGWVCRCGVQNHAYCHFCRNCGAIFDPNRRRPSSSGAHAVGHVAESIAESIAEPIAEAFSEAFTETESIAEPLADSADSIAIAEPATIADAAFAESMAEAWGFTDPIAEPTDPTESIAEVTESIAPAAAFTESIDLSIGQVIARFLTRDGF